MAYHIHSGLITGFYGIVLANVGIGAQYDTLMLNLCKIGRFNLRFLKHS